MQNKFFINAKQIECIKNGAIICAQTDTTAGFLSTSQRAINAAKGRDLEQNCIKTYASLRAALKDFRLPNASKNIARKAKRTSIALGAKSLRIVHGGEHARLLSALERAGIFGVFSSSANAHSEHFCADFALRFCDFFAAKNRLISAQNPRAKAYILQHFAEKSASKMLKFHRNKMRKIR